MQTVLVANRKGGVGKTLIAVTLASALAARGGRVALADADRQRSSLDWLARRPEGIAQIRALDWTKTGDIGEHPKKLDWLVIDAPGALRGSRAEALIAEARAVFVPVQPGFFDVRSTSAFLEDIDEIKRIRKGKVPLHVVANRAREDSRAGRALAAFFADQGLEPTAWIPERSAYGQLAADGMTIFDRETKAIRTLRTPWESLLAAIGDGSASK